MAKKKSKRETRRNFTPGSNATKVAVSKEFNPDYTDVIQDLKRIGILAASFVVILVVLSLFIN